MINIDTKPALRHTINLAKSSCVQYRTQIPKNQRLISVHRDTSYQQSAVALEVIENATLVCAHRTIVAYYSDGQPVDFCQIGDTKRAGRIRDIRKPKEVKGSLALFTSLAPECYYHWLMDTMPGLEVLIEAGEQLNDIENFYFSIYCQSFQSATLKQYGVHQEQVLSTFSDTSHSHEELLHARVGRLLIPRFRDLEGGWPHQWIAPRLRSRFAAEQFWNTGENVESDKPKKIYVTRGTSRRHVLNEEQLVPVLVDAGFTIVDMAKLSLEDQIQTAASADVICGPHGAGLANAIFAKPGSELIEFCGSYLTRHFRIVAEVAGLKYRVFRAGIDSNNQPLQVSNKVEERTTNFRVDVDRVKTMFGA